jgi:hypothetical protein
VTEAGEPDAPGWYPGEISALNPGAIRGPHGIWNEETLPVLEWESPLHRVVIPYALQLALNLEVPVLRWSSFKRDRIIREHAADTEVIETINRYLPNVRIAGPDPRPNRREFLAFFEANERWYRAVFGIDRSGSVNIVSVYGTNKPPEIRRWVRDMRSPRMKRLPE